MRISDWSSDVCSSDLIEAVALDIAAEIGLLSHGDVDSADGQIRDLVTAANFRERPDRRRRTRAGPRDLGENGGVVPLILHAHDFDVGIGILVEAVGIGADDEARAGGLVGLVLGVADLGRSEEHTSELQSLMRISYA